MQFGLWEAVYPSSVNFPMMSNQSSEGNSVKSRSASTVLVGPESLYTDMAYSE